MSEEYELRTIKDIFDKIPADRVEDCMKELTTLICTSKQLAETMRLVMSDVSGQEVPGPLYTFLESITWKDDGEGLLRAGFPLGEQKLCMEIKRGRGREVDSARNDEPPTE